MVNANTITAIDTPKLHQQSPAFANLYSAPFEVVPYTEEPFSHHMWTLHPPQMLRSLSNVPLEIPLLILENGFRSYIGENRLYMRFLEGQR